MMNLGTLVVPFFMEWAKMKHAHLLLTWGSRFFRMFALGLVLLAGAGNSSVRAEGALETIEITTARGVQPLSVEVMRTPEEQERGLMFRRFMPADRGMLFDFHAEAPVMMWMKNTYISLDMVFTDKSGQVTWVVENAEPMSEDIIPSNGPVYAVLEINGGAAARLGIKRGDKVKASIFQK